MKKLLFSILLSSSAVMAQTAPFNSIETKASVQVTVIQSDAISYTIEGSESDKKNIKTEIKDGKLIITNEGEVSDDARVKVNIKDLNYVSVSGTGDLETEGMINTPQIEIRVSGAGDAALNVTSKNVKVQVSGAGDLKLTGTADNFNANVSGAGDLKAADLETKNSFVISTGAGDAKVNVKDTIDAKVSGAGSIIYKGDPAERQVTISGAGSVRQSGDNEEEISIDATITGSDTTRIKWKGKKLIIIENKDSTSTSRKNKSSKPEKKKVWAGLELGVNGYFNSAGTLRTPFTAPFLDLDYKKSYVFNLNFLEHSFRIHRNYVMFTTGMGIQFNRYAFDKNYTLVPGIDTLKGSITGIDFKKNLLKTNYLTAPLLLQFNTSQKAKKSFHLATGVVLGYNFATFSKQVYETGGEKYKIKVHDDYQVNPFKADATVRLGYGNFNVFATYSLNPLFDKQVAPELYPFTLGIRLIGL